MNWIKVNWPKEEACFKAASLGTVSIPQEEYMLRLRSVGTPGTVAINEETIKKYGLIEPVWLKDGDVWITHAEDASAVLHFYVHISGKTYWTLGASDKAYSFIKKLYDDAV